jgi:hypothetical protein
MSAHRVQCINKNDRYNAHERIRDIGGLNGDSSRWSLTQANAIQSIEAGQYSFYVEQPLGHRVNVIVAVSSYGHKYLKTTADREQPDNLLSLPECP